jgi:quercetin dioxygenase-like cupin family protein
MLLQNKIFNHFKILEIMINQYRHTGKLGIITFILLFIGIVESATAQKSGITRIDLQRHYLSSPKLETVQARIDFDPGALAPNHYHPGEEVIYVLEGLIEYQIEGQAPQVLKAGDVLFIPFGKVHSAKNVGTGSAKELATYIVEKGKPLVTLSK